MQVVVNNTLVNYSVTGEGSVVLFLHGWGADIATFELLIKDLAHTHKCIALDLPGMGKSEKPKKVFDLDLYADFVIDFLRKIDIETKGINIVGHSNGVSIAIKISNKLSDDVAKLVFIAGAGIRSGQKLSKAMLKSIAKSGDKIAWIFGKKIQASIRQKFYEKIGSEMLMIKGLEKTFRNVVDEDMAEQSSHIKQPTLLIYGENDTATPKEYGEIYASKITDSHLKIIEGVGHYPMLDKPSIISTLITRFLNENN